MKFKYGLNPKKHQAGRRKNQPGWRRARATLRQAYETDAKGTTRKVYFKV